MTSVSKKPDVLARRLREAREAIGISQRQLGIDAGWDPTVASPRVNQYERGKHAPDLGTLSILAKVLDRPLAYFYAEDDELATIIMAYYLASPSAKKDWLKRASAT